MRNSDAALDDHLFLDPGNQGETHDRLGSQKIVIRTNQFLNGDLADLHRRHLLIQVEFSQNAAIKFIADNLGIDIWGIIISQGRDIFEARPMRRLILDVRGERRADLRCKPIDRALGIAHPPKPG